MIYRRIKEANGWEVGDLAIKIDGEYRSICVKRADSVWDDVFELTDLTLEEAELIMAL